MYHLLFTDFFYSEFSISVAQKPSFCLQIFCCHFLTISSKYQEELLALLYRQTYLWMCHTLTVQESNTIQYNTISYNIISYIDIINLQSCCCTVYTYIYIYILIKLLDFCSSNQHTDLQQES